jgi:hypothetical protein
MWWSGEFSSPAPDHSFTETMTQQDYDNDLVFRTNGEERFRFDGNGPWKSATPSQKLEIKNKWEPNSIIFNTKDVNEIAKFTNEGFYYKGEFIEDAGEVYRLLKEVLGQMKSEQSQ